MVLKELGTAKKEKNSGKKNNEVYSGAYYTLGGLITGFIFDELWHRYHLPTDKISESLVTHQPIENVNGVSTDKFIVTLLSGLLALGDVFMGIKGGAASAGGFLMGYNYSNSFRNQRYIGQL